MVSLLSALTVMAPKQDWSGLRETINALKRFAEPARDKRSRIVDSDELREFGEELIAKAEAMVADTSWRRPVTFRDGLMIALLALRPLRRANFCETEIGRNLVRHGDGYLLTFDITEPKTESRIELPFPAEHLAQLERYLAFYPPWLCRLTGHRNPAYPFREPGNRLWISKTGSALSVEGFYKNIRNLTEAKFGFNVNPHLFRDCLATSIAINDPEHVGITRILLNHKTSATAERFYNQAGSFDASRRVQACIGGIRQQIQDDAEGRDRDV